MVGEAAPLKRLAMTAPDITNRYRAHPCRIRAMYMIAIAAKAPAVTALPGFTTTASGRGTSGKCATDRFVTSRESNVST